MPTGEFKVVGWRARNNSICRGEAWVETPSGLVIRHIPIFRRGGSTRVGRVSRPVLDHTGRELLREPNGKPRWEPVIAFVYTRRRDRFNQQVLLDALSDADPDVFDDGEDA